MMPWGGGDELDHDVAVALERLAHVLVRRERHVPGVRLGFGVHGVAWTKLFMTNTR